MVLHGITWYCMVFVLCYAEVPSHLLVIRVAHVPLLVVEVDVHLLGPALHHILQPPACVRPVERGDVEGVPIVRVLVAKVVETYNNKNDNNNNINNNNNNDNNNNNNNNYNNYNDNNRWWIPRSKLRWMAAGWSGGTQENWSGVTELQMENAFSIISSITSAVRFVSGLVGYL